MGLHLVPRVPELSFFGEVHHFMRRFSHFRLLGIRLNHLARRNLRHLLCVFPRLLPYLDSCQDHRRHFYSFEAVFAVEGVLYALQRATHASEAQDTLAPSVDEGVGVIETPIDRGDGWRFGISLGLPPVSLEFSFRRVFLVVGLPDTRILTLTTRAVPLVGWSLVTPRADVVHDDLRMVNCSRGTANACGS